MIDPKIGNRPIGDDLIDRFEAASAVALDMYLKSFENKQSNKYRYQYSSSYPGCPEPLYEFLNDFTAFLDKLLIDNLFLAKRLYYDNSYLYRKCSEHFTDIKTKLNIKEVSIKRIETKLDKNVKLVKGWRILI